MDTHPITDNRICLLCATVLLTLLAAVHTMLLVCYARTGWQTAAVDAVATTACSATLAYLTWFMAGLLAMPAFAAIFCQAACDTYLTCFTLTSSAIICV